MIWDRRLNVNSKGLRVYRYVIIVCCLTFPCLSLSTYLSTLSLSLLNFFLFVLDKYILKNIVYEAKVADVYDSPSKTLKVLFLTPDTLHFNWIYDCTFVSTQFRTLTYLTVHFWNTCISYENSRALIMHNELYQLEETAAWIQIKSKSNYKLMHAQTHTHTHKGNIEIYCEKNLLESYGIMNYAQ